MEKGKFTPDLVAPCGMNCGVCRSHLAFSRGVPRKRGYVTHCSGCLPRKKNCFIKRGCKQLSKNKVRFCYECEKMPCANVDRVDRRYRARYDTSLVGNLREIEEKGMQAFRDLRQRGSNAQPAATSSQCMTANATRVNT